MFLTNVDRGRCIIFQTSRKKSFFHRSEKWCIHQLTTLQYYIFNVIEQLSKCSFYEAIDIYFFTLE